MTATTTRTARNAIAKAAARTGRIVTIQDLGQGVGAQDRMELSVSDAFHKAYVKAKDDVRKQMRVEFIIGYVMGRLTVSQDVAQTIVKQTRTERTAEREKAVNAAGQKFAYHVSRTGKKAAGNSRATPARRVPADFQAAAVKFVGSLYEEPNKAAFKETIELLTAMYKRLK